MGTRKKWLGGFIVLALIASACGGGNESAQPDAPVTTVGDSDGGDAGAPNALGGTQEPGTSVAPSDPEGQTPPPIPPMNPDELDKPPKGNTKFVFPPGWVLVAGWARFSAAGREQVFLGTHECSVTFPGVEEQLRPFLAPDTVDESNGSDSTDESNGSVFFSSTFQKDERRNQGPNASFAAFSDRAMIFSLYIGQGGERGEEWSGNGGSPSITGSAGDLFLHKNSTRIFIDHNRNNALAAGHVLLGDGLWVIADWTGSATENFTGEMGAASVDIECMFVSPETLEQAGLAFVGAALGELTP